MELALDEPKKPVKVKARRYPVKQRKRPQQCFQSFFESTYLISSPKSGWQAAPHIKTKDLNVIPSTTTRLRPYNIKTTYKNRTIPSIEAEVAHFDGGACFPIFV